jgi:hypothetical protein
MDQSGNRTGNLGKIPTAAWHDRLAALLASSRRTAGGLELAAGDDRVTKGRLKQLQYA